MQKEIKIESYRPEGTTSFVGRKQGEDVRRELKLDNYDKKNAQWEIKFIIPENTTSFNPSFYLGLLFKSIKSLGIEKFKDRYHFIIESDMPEIKRVLEKNLEDAYKHAIQSLNSSSISFPA